MSVTKKGKITHPIRETKSLELDNNNYYFAGFDSTSVYLGNRKFPFSLTIIDTAMGNIHKTFLKTDNKDYLFKNISLKVKPPNVYVYDGTVPVILKGKIGNDDVKTISYKDAFFNQLAIVDSSHFIVRTQSTKTKNFALGYLNLDSNVKFRIDERILKKQIDGVFDIDGHLIADIKDHNFIYVYAYRNQFIVMDEKMHVKYNLHTIDTIRNAQIKTVKLSNGTYKMSQPPLKVNNNATTYRGFLFNQSTLIGKYEAEKIWNKAYIIDIYRTDSQNYIGSFYIYKKQGQKLNSFIVTDKYLFVILDNKLTQYQINSQISKYFR